MAELAVAAADGVVVLKGEDEVDVVAAGDAVVGVGVEWVSAIAGVTSI